MPHWCAAIGCAITSASHPDVSFFCFPSDQRLKHQWLINLKRSQYTPSAHARVCSRHFTSDCFDPFLERKKWFGCSTTAAKRKLVPGACPTIFSFSDTQPRIKRGALQKRLRREILFSDPSHLAKTKKRRAECATTNSSTGNGLPCEEAPESASVTPLLPLPPDDDQVLDHTEPDVAETSETPVTSICTSACQTEVSDLAPKNVTVYSIGTMTRPRLIRHFKAQHCPRTKTKECQTDGTNMTDMAVQCDLAVEEIPTEQKVQENEEVDEEEIDENDVEWLPNLEVEENQASFTEDGDFLRNDSRPIQERKFLVFESCLLQLLSVCSLCFGPCKVMVKKVLGTFVLLRSTCSRGHIKEWGSQPFHKGLPLGNLLTASTLLFSGSSPAKVLNMFRHLRMQMFCIRTYFMVQSAYLCPAVERLWSEETRRLLRERKGRPLKLGGDGRCCSAGHTAKYGAYSLMDLETSTVIETQLIQSSEVKNSAAMELEGLKRCLEKLASDDIEVEELVTDRHCQVKKHMRLNESAVKHHFDVWHMAKGLKKKLEAVGKKKGLEVVGRWEASISNHMYWCAATSGGEGPLVREKWLSLLNHLCNIHVHSGKLFPKCAHGDVEDREWLQPGSRALKNIENVITKTVFLKDLQKLAPGEQTSSLESFHNVICHFAPKHGHFFHEAMECRLRIAALHFNENSRRQQATTQTGQLKYGIAYAKANQGKPVVKEVKVPITFGYVDELLKAVLDRRTEFPSYSTARTGKSTPIQIPPVATKYNHEDKKAVIQRHCSRFS